MDNQHLIYYIIHCIVSVGNVPCPASLDFFVLKILKYSKGLHQHDIRFDSPGINCYCNLLSGAFFGGDF